MLKWRWLTARERETVPQEEEEDKTNEKVAKERILQSFRQFLKEENILHLRSTAFKTLAIFLNSNLMNPSESAKEYVVKGLYPLLTSAAGGGGERGGGQGAPQEDRSPIGSLPKRIAPQEARSPGGSLTKTFTPQKACSPGSSFAQEVRLPQGPLPKRSAL